MIIESQMIKEENVVTFFYLLEEKKAHISIDNYWDLYKLSEIFEVCTLKNKLFKYAEKHSNDVSFIISLLIERQKSQKQETKFDEIINNFIDKYPSKIEEILENQINECLCNGQFGEIEISTIYRILSKSSDKKISSDLLFQFINQSIEERHILFSFIKLSELNETNFNILYQNITTKEQNSTQHYYNYLPQEIEYIKILKEKEHKFQETIKENKKMKEEKNQLEKQINELLIQHNKLKEENNQIKEYMNNKIDELTKNNKTMNKNIENLKSKNKSITEENEKLNKQLISIQTETKEKQQIIDNIKAENTKLTTTILTKEQEIINIKNQFSFNEEIIKLFYSYEDDIKKCFE